MLKCGIHEIYNDFAVDIKYCKHLDDTLFKSFDDLARKFIYVWRQQEDDREAKKKEAESLYHFKYLLLTPLKQPFVQ